MSVENEKEAAEANGAPARAGRASSPTLARAAFSGLLAVLEQRLAEGADPDEADLHLGLTPLAAAARRGRLECLERLLAAGADACLGDEDGWTPLMHAAIAGKSAIVARLIEAGGVEATNKNGESALHLAIQKGSTPCVRALMPLTNLMAADNEGTNPLLAVVEAAFSAQKAIALIDAMRKAGAQFVPDHRGWTALIAAAAGGDETLLDALLERGAGDPRAVNADGINALMFAAGAGSLACVQRLLPLSDAAARDLRGRSAADWTGLCSKQRGDYEKIRGLLLARQEADEIAAAAGKGAQLPKKGAKPSAAGAAKPPQRRARSL
jgi:uncharacterized protein